MIEYRKYITRRMLRDEQETLFVFGDNMERSGLGGQAYEMRGEPNAVGIATKIFPNMTSAAFFSDADIDLWRGHSFDAMNKLRKHSGIIVWPSDGIGTGRASLKTKAPMIWAELEAFRIELENSSNYS